jgi:hypothetical protein
MALGSMQGTWRYYSTGTASVLCVHRNTETRDVSCCSTSDAKPNVLSKSNCPNRSRSTFIGTLRPMSRLRSLRLFTLPLFYCLAYVNKPNALSLALAAFMSTGGKQLQRRCGGGCFPWPQYTQSHSPHLVAYFWWLTVPLSLR